jgi:hypothetical protein
MIWHSHSSSYKDYCLSGCDATYLVKTYKDCKKNMMPPSSDQKRLWCNGKGKERRGRRFFKMSVNFYHTTWHHTQENHSLSVRSGITNTPGRPINFKTAHYTPHSWFSDIFKIISSQHIQAPVYTYQFISTFPTCVSSPIIHLQQNLYCRHNVRIYKF